MFEIWECFLFCFNIFAFLVLMLEIHSDLVLMLEISCWTGNAATGSVPGGVPRLKTLTALSLMRHLLLLHDMYIDSQFGMCSLYRGATLCLPDISCPGVLHKATH